jgi:hypothetical protein
MSDSKLHGRLADRPEKIRSILSGKGDDWNIYEMKMIRFFLEELLEDD